MDLDLVINLDAPGPRIRRHIYGHFAEHLGRCIYGGFYVGDEGSIPNKNGLRLDVIEAFRNLNTPVLRWPGGCFADEYHWMDGIGPREKRPSMVNTHWGGVLENNHFGTHEFFELCEELGAEPYITGNLGSGSVREMSEWLEYITFDGKSPMADLRRQNGREKPWRIKFWGVGNENWGCGGNMEPGFYADLARQYATYCRNYGENKLYKIACGPNTDDYEWMDVLMKKLVGLDPRLNPARYVQGISLHYYSIAGTWEQKGRALDADEDSWLVLMEKSLFADTLLEKHSAIMDRYDPSRKLGLLFDEWGTWHRVEEGTNPGFLYQQNSIRDAISAALHFNIFHKHSSRLYMANLAQAVNVLQAPILTKGPRLILTPTYHVFEMNKGHQDAVNLPVYFTKDSPRRESVSTTIPTLSVSASRKEAETGKAPSYLISIVNSDPDRDCQLKLDLRGGLPGLGRARILGSRTLNAHNSFDNPEAVKPEPIAGLKMHKGSLNLEAPAHSFITLELKG